MTWKEFKDAAEEEGVTDDMEIQYIDRSMASPSDLNVSLPNHEEGNNWHELMIH